ncbi:MAG: hypothetical protein ABEL76_15740 [Bradymonadaceae bacterium]
MVDRLILLATGALAVFLHAGCATQCKSVSDSYERAKQSLEGLERADAAPSDPNRAHFAVSVRRPLIRDLARRFLSHTFRERLAQTFELGVGSNRSVAVRTRPSLSELTLRPAFETCALCFDVSATIGGRAAIDVPGMDTRNIRLRGSVDAVAPLELAPRDSGRIALVLRLGEVLRRATTDLDLELTGLPESWKTVLGHALEKRFLRLLTEAVPEIDLYTFSPPTIADLPLELVPVTVDSDAESGTVTAALKLENFRIASARPVEELAAAARPPEGRNAGVSFSAPVVTEFLRRAVATDRLPDRYTRTGRPSRNGPVRVVPGRLQLSSSDEGGLRARLRFRGWVLDRPAVCFRFHAAANAHAELGPDGTRVTIDSVRLLDTSDAGLAPGLAGWKRAPVVKAGGDFLSASVSPNRANFPGGGFEIRRGDLRATGRIAVLHATVAPPDRGASE